MLLALSLGISVVASLFFSAGLNNPVKKLVRSLQHPTASRLPRSRIKEFSVISEKFDHILQANQDIRRDLSEKSSLLRYYAYTNKLRKIYNPVADLAHLSVIDKPFHFILFHLSFKSEFYDEFQMERKGAGAEQVVRFAESVLSRLRSELLVLNLDDDFLNRSLKDLRLCHTYERLASLLGEAVRQTIQLIADKEEKRDYIIRFVLDFIDKHYAEQISLDILADKLNITGSYLSSRFKESTGTNFIDHLNTVRVSVARELLLQPEMRIQEVARKSGYQNINSFNRIFKKMTGYTPSEFRQQHGLKQ